MDKGWWSRLAMTFAAAVLLTGCSLLKPDAELDAAGKQTYEQARKGDPALMPRMVPEARTAETQAQLANLRTTVIPTDEPKGVQATGWTKTASTSGPMKAVVQHTYDYGDRRAVVNTSLRRDASGKTWLVEGFHVQVATVEEMAVNNFTLVGKSPVQYGFLAATILSPLLMVIALVTVIRRRNVRWKWLWCVLAFFGLFSFSMNWTSGEIAAQWLTVQLVGAGVTTTSVGFAPWLLKFTFPLGALLILMGVWARPGKPKRASKTAPEDS